MQYLGGKSRISKQIGAFLNEEIQKHNVEKYIEPFCGACWITQEIKCEIRIACDIHPDLILMWKELQKGWIPPELLSEEEYKNLKSSDPSALRAFAGFGCSFGGKFFGGYARPSKGRKTLYSRSCRNSLLKKQPKLLDVYYKNCSYKEIPIEKLDNRLIYCDPPYANTTGYSCGDFNHVDFYNWCRKASEKNHVYISEYASPSDFEAVLEIETKTDMRNKEAKQEPRIEKLFKFKN